MNLRHRGLHWRSCEIKRRHAHPPSPSRASCLAEALSAKRLLPATLQSICAHQRAALGPSHRDIAHIKRGRPANRADMGPVPDQITGSRGDRLGRTGQANMYLCQAPIDSLQAGIVPAMRMDGCSQAVGMPPFPMGHRGLLGLVHFQPAILLWVQRESNHLLE